MPTRPCVLIILDGWGIAPPGPGNAIAIAATPVLDGTVAGVAAQRPGRIRAGRRAARRADRQLGGGAPEPGGRLPGGAGAAAHRPRRSSPGAFFENPALAGAVDHARDAGTTLHLLGLFSYGGVHSHASHLYALLELAARRGLRRVAVHAFLDGRDTPPRQALKDLPRLEEALRRTGAGRIASVSGRYYAMDRDQRWDRTELAYRALVGGQGEHAPSAEEAVRRAYAAGQTDEFVVPTLIDAPPEPVAGDARRTVIGDGDAVIWFNFRADRARAAQRGPAAAGLRGLRPPAPPPAAALRHPDPLRPRTCR